MKKTVKIVVAAIFVLGLQESAFAKPNRCSHERPPVVIDARLTQARLTRIVENVRNTGHPGEGRYERLVQGYKYAVEVESIVNPRSGKVPGLATLEVQERLVSETARSRRGALGPAVPPRVLQQHWAPLKLRVELVQPSPAGNRWLTVQVGVGPRRVTGRAFGELFNVGVTSLREDEVPGGNFARHYLGLVRKVLLGYVPRVSRLARR